MAGNWPWAQVKVQTAEPLGYDGIKIPYWLHRQANTQWLPSKLHSGLIGKVSTTTLHIGIWSTRTSESWCEQNSDTPSCFLPTKGSSSLNPSNNKWFCTKPSFSEPHILSEISESWHRNLCLYQGVLAIFETMTILPSGFLLHLADKLCIDPSLPPGQVEVYMSHTSMPIWCQAFHPEKLHSPCRTQDRSLWVLVEASAKFDHPSSRVQNLPHIRVW